MHHFQAGEHARILKRGVAVDVIVLRQLGEFVYVFDRENRTYQFRVKDVLPAREQAHDIPEYDGPRHAAASNDSSVTV